VARAYRGRRLRALGGGGDKGNHWRAASATPAPIGLVKAALEALDGLDLYGPHGDGSAGLHIPQRRCGMRLRRRPPGPACRGSASKEVDSACLSVIGYPRLGRWKIPLLVDAQGQDSGGSSAAGTATKRFRSRWPPDGGGATIAFHYELEELASFESNRVRNWPLFFAY